MYKSFREFFLFWIWLHGFYNMFYIISSKKNEWPLRLVADYFGKLLLAWSSLTLVTEQFGSNWTDIREIYIENFD